MAINANHPFEELNGVRCAVVEKNCTQSRVDFLKYILEGNGFEVMVVASPPPKAPPAAAKPAAPAHAAPAASAGAATTPSSVPIASVPNASSVANAFEASASVPVTPEPAAPAPVPAPAAAETPQAAVSPAPPPPLPETFTVGVTDVTFNTTNAIFGRLLRSPDGRVVTMAYWQQKEEQSRDDVPYYAK